MSNLIFPTFTPNLGGPSWPVKKTHSYKTIIQTPANNRGENRISLTPYPIWKFELDYSFLLGDFSPAQSSSALQTLAGFMGQVQGSFQDWLYSDPYDNAVVTANGLIAYGDGVTTQFQLQRQVAGFNDIIQNPINPTVSVSGTAQTQFQAQIGLENLLLQSEAFSTTPWSTGGLGGVAGPTITANTTVAPDGTTTADTLAFPATTSSQESYVLQNASSVNLQNTTFTYSVWLKCASGTQQATLALLATNSGMGANTTVTVTTTWQRFSVSATFDAAAAGFCQVYIYQSNVAAQTIIAWGAQVERGAAASGYLPTTTAISIPNGVVTFVTAPAANAKITWAGNFYFRCRFEEDEQQDLQEFLYQFWELDSLKFRSVIL